MSNEHIKVPWTIAFRIITVVLNLAVVASVLWIRAEIRKELEGYVTTKEFESYQKSHTLWGDQVARRIEATLEENSKRIDRIDNKLDRFIEAAKNK